MATGTTVDELIVKIVADTKQLRKDLDQIKGKTRAAGAAGGAAFAGMGAGLSKVKGAALGAAAAVAGVGAAVVGIAKVGMEFEDLADSLNTVFGSIKAGDQAMQRILEFSQKTPFQVETATKAFIALKSAGIEPNNRMLQVFADTASTSTDQLGVFEALVRTVQRSASGGLGLEELNMIMDRGIDVLGILNDELGLTKNEIADFGATAEGAKLITDALINGLERKFGGAMESKMDNLSTKASNMTIAFKKLADEIFQSGLGDSLKETADALADIATNIALAIAASRGAGIGIVLTGDPEKDLDMVNREIERQQKILDNIRAEQPSMRGGGTAAEAESRRKRYEAVESVIANLRDTQGLLFDQYTKGMLDTDQLTDAEKDNLKIKGMAIRAGSLLQAEIEKLIGDTELLTFANENLQLVLDENKDAFAKLGIETVPQLRERLDEINQAASDLAVTFDTELRQAVINQSNAFTTDFVNSLLEGESALESFKNFARNIVSQIIAIFMQMAVVNQILNSAFGLTGANRLPTISLGGGGISQAPTFDTGQAGVGGIPLSGIGGAGGGKMSIGQPRLVGERGPELFIPNANGTLLNNMNTKNAMGGGSPVIVNQSINFATGVVPTVRAEVTRMLPQIADVTKGAVLESAMRGGSYAKGLRRG